MRNPEDKSGDDNGNPPSPYRHFSATAWGRLRDDTPLPLTEEEVVGLRGRGETVSIAEVEQIYLPLSRLLNFYAEGVQTLHGATNAFLGNTQKVPYIIGVAGSVAVGKSTTSRILKELLARWPSHPKVELVTTDGFLHPNKILEERGLADRKGFPESFDLAGLREFLTNVKSGEKGLQAPTYSHIIYDVVPDQYLEVDQPDILIVEGLNVLQPARPDDASEGIPFVSDFFDFSIFIDVAHLWGVDYDSSIDGEGKVRSSVGLGLDWFTVIGPINFTYAYPITKDTNDVTQEFSFNLGTTF